MNKMNVPCKIKVQSGSIGGEPMFVWVDAIIERKIDNYQYVVRTTDKEGLFYLEPQEIFVDFYTIKLWLDEQL